MGAVKNGRGDFAHETLKSATSEEWVYELNWFFACWLWSNNFWLYWYCTLYLWLLNPILLQSCLLDPPGVVGRILWNRFCLSFRPAICPGVFLLMDHYIFMNFSMVLEAIMTLRVTESDFLEKNLLPQKLVKWVKNRPKIQFSEFKEIFGQYFLLNFFYNENLYYLLCSC